MNVKDLYDRLPVFAQNFACNLQGFYINKTRYNKDFFRTLDEFLLRGTWSVEQRIEYRNKKLQQLVKHCYETVPYYTRTMNRIGLLPCDVKTMEDLSVLPMIDKHTVVNMMLSFFQPDGEYRG